jgi:hypothetical protein
MKNKIIGKLYNNTRFNKFDVIADYGDDNMAIVIGNYYKNDKKIQFLCCMIFTKTGKCVGSGGKYVSPNDKSIYLGKIDLKKYLL